MLDSHKNVGLIKSRLAVNKGRGACKREDVFAATPLIAAMRLILSRAASRGHGRWLWDVSVAFFQATIEEKVFVRPPKNMRKVKAIWILEKEMYGTKVASSRWPRLVRETLRDCREGVFLHRRTQWSESGFSYRPDPKHVAALVETLSLEDARQLQHQSHVTLEASYMSDCIGQDGRVVCDDGTEISSGEILKRVARYLAEHEEVPMNYPYQVNPPQIDWYTDAGRDNTILNHSWNVVELQVRVLSSGEPEFYSQGSGAARALLMKHICHEAGEPKNKLMVHRDSVASGGWHGSEIGSCEMLTH